MINRLSKIFKKQHFKFFLLFKTKRLYTRVSGYYDWIMAQLNSQSSTTSITSPTSTLTSTLISTTPPLTPGYGQCGFSVFSSSARIVGGIQATV